MRESEAAAYLKLSARTLRNYRRRGVLAYREIAGRTRPQIEYDQAEVDRLKGELEAKQTDGPKPKGVKSKAIKRLTLGLSSQEHQELSKEAERYGMGVNEYARKLVREGLESRFLAEVAELRGEIKRLSRDHERIHRDIAGGFEAVLEFGGLDAESAKKWVTDNIR